MTPALRWSAITQSEWPCGKTLVPAKSFSTHQNHFYVLLGTVCRRSIYRDNNTSNIWIQSTAFLCMRAPMTGRPLLAMKHMRLSHGHKGHESTISHEEVSEGEQKEKRQGTNRRTDTVGSKGCLPRDGETDIVEPTFDETQKALEPRPSSHRQTQHRGKTSPCRYCRGGRPWSIVLPPAALSSLCFATAVDSISPVN